MDEMPFVFVFVNLFMSILDVTFCLQPAPNGDSGVLYGIFLSMTVRKIKASAL